MSTLTGPRRDALSGNADALVIFVHGYGADGEDLIGIGEMLAEHVPNVSFLAPDAPDRCTNNPLGYQWFPIPRLDGSSEVAAAQGFTRAVGLFDSYLDGAFEAEGIAPDRTVLVGFSQGTMISLHVGPRRDNSLAGIVGLSGRLFAPERLPVEIKTRPPVLLIHGDMDEVVPPSSLPEAADGLINAGMQVATHISKGMGHGIAPDGLELTLSFIQQALSDKNEHAAEL